MKPLTLIKSFRFLTVWLLIFLVACADSVAEYRPMGFATDHRRVLRWLPLVEEVSRRYNIDPAFLLALILAESSGNPMAISTADCRGLTQISAAVLQDYFPHASVSRLYNPEFNLMVCAMHLARLRQLIHRDFYRLSYQDELSLMAAAWHAGWGSVRSSHGIPNRPATQNFVRKVMSYYQQFKTIL